MPSGFKLYSKPYPNTSFFVLFWVWCSWCSWCSFLFYFFLLFFYFWFGVLCYDSRGEKVYEQENS